MKRLEYKYTAGGVEFLLDGVVGSFMRIGSESAVTNNNYKGLSYLNDIYSSLKGDGPDFIFLDILSEVGSFLFHVPPVKDLNVVLVISLDTYEVMSYRPMKNPRVQIPKYKELLEQHSKVKDYALVTLNKKFKTVSIEIVR